MSICLYDTTGCCFTCWEFNSAMEYVLGVYLRVRASLALRVPSRFQSTRFNTCLKVAFNKVDLYSIPI
jgi:hypothetical protein